jgi:hypothetical protein
MKRSETERLLGKGPKQPLRLSKSGHPRIEEGYATHFVKKERGAKDKASNLIPSDRRAAEGVNIEPGKEPGR